MRAAGKEDPVELDSSLILHSDLKGVDLGGRRISKKNTTPFGVTLLTWNNSTS